MSGQFLSADNAQGMDPYAYVGNNPENWTDPTGQRVATCAARSCDGEGEAGGGGGGGDIDSGGGDGGSADAAEDTETVRNVERAGEEGIGDASLDENDPAENIEAAEAQTRA